MVSFRQRNRNYALIVFLFTVSGLVLILVPAKANAELWEPQQGSGYFTSAQYLDWMTNYGGWGFKDAAIEA